MLGCRIATHKEGKEKNIPILSSHKAVKCVAFQNKFAFAVGAANILK